MTILRIYVATSLSDAAEVDCRGSMVEVGYALGRCQVVFALGDRLSTTLMADGCEWVADEYGLRARLHGGAR